MTFQVVLCSKFNITKKNSGNFRNPCMVYLPKFTIKINQMWVNIPYMDPMCFGRFLPTKPSNLGGWSMVWSFGPSTFSSSLKPFPPCGSVKRGGLRPGRARHCGMSEEIWKQCKMQICLPETSSKRFCKKWGQMFQDDRLFHKRGRYFQSKRQQKPIKDSL